jgi:hypothetical protein
MRTLETFAPANPSLQGVPFKCAMLSSSIFGIAEAALISHEATPLTMGRLVCFLMHQSHEVKIGRKRALATATLFG